MSLFRNSQYIFSRLVIGAQAGVHLRNGYRPEFILGLRPVWTRGAGVTEHEHEFYDANFWIRTLEPCFYQVLRFFVAK